MTASTTNPSVCLIVLNYNGRDLLERFLPAITGTSYRPLEIVVVDNASSDDSVEWLRKIYPSVTVLPLNENRCYAGGNNAGVRYAIEKGHDFIVLANNDIEPHPEWISRAVQLAIEKPHFGIIGFNVFGEAERVAFEKAARSNIESRWREVVNVDGCSLFCSRELFQEVGELDERYQFYAEETDFERRALLGGWKLAAVDAPVWHLGEASTSRLGLWRCYLQMRNSIRLQFKLSGLWAGLMMCKTVVNRACNPFLNLNVSEDYTLKRFRPTSLPVNAVLAFGAIMWNLTFLAQTLLRGRKDKLRITTARRRERF